ncbi:hypothetical protein NJBCHELONAE_47830 [Mycobacteroides chelonae]|uniref:hypothetical protein n=1 Tax=Mycobacteroides chelonae TaxID=1774 RepID=UPI001F31246D|nr:hypothetical protein [Mycobacteroides chelonae]GLE59470.1 hypothetical protein NJBCHELONAE_47830 [Mycobacteroides chelonae]
MADGGGLCGELVEQIRELLDEPEPVAPPSVDMSVFGDGRSAMDRAGFGFGFAVQAVSAADYGLRLGDWEERQRVARGLLDVLGVGEFIDVVGSPELAEVGAQLRRLRECGAERLRHSARTMRIVGQGHRRVADVIEQARGRLTDVMVKGRGRIGQVPPEDVERQHALVAGVQREMIIVSEVGVKRINTLTRRVLDCGEDTASVSVATWLVMHGLDVSSPPELT